MRSTCDLACSVCLMGCLLSVPGQSCFAQEPKEIATIRNLTGTCWSIAFAPDGKTLASSTRDASVKLWDIATGKERLELKEGGYSVKFSPDGKVLASGGKNNVITLWDPVTGQKLATLGGGQSKSFFFNHCVVAFSPDGKTIASTDDETVKMWDMQNRKLKGTLKGHTDIVRALVFSPDGKTLASGGEDNLVKLWSTVTLNEQMTLKDHCDYVLSLAFSPDGTLLASGSGDWSTNIWRTATGELQSTFQSTPGDCISSVAFSPNGQLLATGHRLKGLKLSNVRTGKELATLKGHDLGIEAVAISPDGKILAAACERTISLWELPAGWKLGR